MTSTDLALNGDPDGLELTVPGGDLSTLEQLREWLEAASVAQQIAAVICRGPFAPKEFRGDADGTATAILAGMELGFSPSQALRSFYVVHGTASLSAGAMRALVMARGHEISIAERSAERVTVRGRRRGSSDWTDVTWTIDDALRAGLMEVQDDGTLRGHSDPWTKYPATMLANRATTDLCKLMFADVIGGMDGAEELQDVGPGTVTATATVVEPGARAGALAALLEHQPVQQEPIAPASGPVADEAPTPAAAVADDTGLIDQPQWDAINARFRELGVNGPGSRAARLRIIQGLIDRQVEQGRELTVAEAQLVLDNLAGDAGVRVVGSVSSEPEHMQEQQEPAGWPEDTRA